MNSLFWTGYIIPIIGIVVSIVACLYTAQTFYKSSSILDVVEAERRYRWNKQQLEKLFCILSMDCIKDFFSHPDIIRDELWRGLRIIDLNTFQFDGKERDEIVALIDGIGDISLMRYEQTPSKQWKFQTITEKEKYDYEKERQRIDELHSKVKNLSPLFIKVKKILAKYQVNMEDMETKAREFYEKSFVDDLDQMSEPRFSSDDNKTVEDMIPKTIYDGNYLYHFTKFESALKIISSQSILFGDFRNMNDVAEVKRELLGNIDELKIYEEMEKYKSISMTLDKPERGFFIDPLWGHYAEKGNGVCLMFNKEKLIRHFKMKYGKIGFDDKIKYIDDFSNLIFFEGKSQEEVAQYIVNNLQDIFFTKSTNWEYEQEYRFIIRDNTFGLKLEYCIDTLEAVILCLPKENNYKETSEFKILKALLKETPILRYQTSFGKKKLIDEEGYQCDLDISKRELAV